MLFQQQSSVVEKTVDIGEIFASSMQNHCPYLFVSHLAPPSISKS